MRSPMIVAGGEVDGLIGFANEAAVETAAQIATAMTAAERTVRPGMCLKTDTSGLELMHRR